MLKNTLHFSPAKLDIIASYANRMNDEFESGAVGYYHLHESSRALICEANAFWQDFCEGKKKQGRNVENIVLVGMGGSSCGVKALYEMLKFEGLNLKTAARLSGDLAANLNKNVGENLNESANLHLNSEGKNPAPNALKPPKLHILDNTSSSTLHKTLANLSLENTLFIIASKTGTTIEVVSLFKLIIAHFDIALQNLKDNFIFITDENSNLHKLGSDLNVKCFFIPSNVGGRFSVLSSVGIVPLCFLNIDAQALLEGAKACFTDFFTHKKDEILQKAYHYCTHKSAHINVLFSYGDSFKGFNEWYIQLWAESLGKKQGYKRVGRTPVALIGARDQHSFLQLIMDGPKDKSVTFLRAKKSLYNAQIPQISLPFLENCDFANALSLHELLNAQCEATMHALIAEGLSVDLIELDSLDAWHAGYLMYDYELLTSACGIMLGINTYNQPGVEVGKLILKNMLSC